MANVKKFADFVKENTENKGKGVGGDTDLFNRPTPKSTLNKPDLNPVDNLGIRGRQITTEKIDGIVKNVTGGDVYIEDRLTKEIKKYSLSEFLKEFNKAYKKEKKEAEKTYESIKIEEEKLPELKDEDKELLSKILHVNENSSAKELWEKKWESFATNYVSKTKEIEDEDIVDDEKPITEDVLSKIAEEENEKVEDLINEPIKEKPEIKIEKFSDFIKNRVQVRTESVEDELSENSVPKPLKKIHCSDCGDEVSETMEDMERHIYSKHNFKPTVDDMDVLLLEYFPPEVPKKKK